MDFLTAVRLNTLPGGHMFRLQGRASRSEYWWFYLGLLLLGFLGQIGLGLLTFISPIFGLLGGVVLALVLLVLNISAFCCSVRRLHDKDKSGWNLLWILVPLFGVLYVLFLLVMPGTEGENRFGPNPLDESTGLI